MREARSLAPRVTIRGGAQYPVLLPWGFVPAQAVVRAPSLRLLSEVRGPGQWR